MTPTPTTPTPVSPASPTPETPAVEAPASIIAPAPAAAPLTAEALVLPEGFTLDADTSASFLDILNNGALNPTERANALIKLQADIATKSSEAGSQAWNDQQQAWQQEVVNDPILGGPNLEKTIAAIGGLMDRYASPEVRAAFNETGAGNNPHIVRFLHALSSQLREAGPLPSGSPAGAGQQTLEQRLYPTMTQ